ncbi:toprim domain-containing protein [Priestia megaterium]|uniref:toprim domain-containing protein n=1 Tax=Priestia megaterium TaxID=1404 RepID=UPI00366C1C7E
MDKRFYVRKEESMKARDVDLLSYLEAKGETFVKEGKYYRHTEHDSLLIKGNMYAWNSRNETGYGAISFAQMYYGMSFPQAVLDINKGDYKELSHEQSSASVSNEPFRYPKELEVQDQTKAKEYLIRERHIDPRLVHWLFQKDLIAQDKRNNVVFKWREQGGKGKVIGADRQGTVTMKNKRGSFKQVLPNDNPHTGFSVDVGKPKSIHFFESPIDLLSYWSIQEKQLQNTRLISMNGLKPKTVAQSYLAAQREGLTIKELILAVDHDQAGKEFINKMTQVVNADLIKGDLPSVGKDWNDALKKGVKEKPFSKHFSPPRNKPNEQEISMNG